MSADQASGQIEFHRSGEWTGVYVNGKLVRHGDHYLADEWLQARVGVIVVDSDDWLPDGRTPLATLEEVEAETARRNQLRTTALEKRDKAAALLHQAEALEAQAQRPPSA